jgi:hypothetical protein
VQIKVNGGTVDHSQTPLCETCRHSTVIRGARRNDLIVECGRLFGHNQRVWFPVVSCSDYADRREASVGDMEKIAWILRSDLLRSHSGFVRSSSLKDEERHMLEED